MDDLTEEYIEMLKWMVGDMKWRSDSCAFGGGYSPKLLKAMALLRDLESGQKKIVTRSTPTCLITQGDFVHAT